MHSPGLFLLVFLLLFALLSYPFFFFFFVVLSLVVVFDPHQVLVENQVEVVVLDHQVNLAVTNAEDLLDENQVEVNSQVVVFAENQVEVHYRVVVLDEHQVEVHYRVVVLDPQVNLPVRSVMDNYSY